MTKLNIIINSEDITIASDHTYILLENPYGWINPTWLRCNQFSEDNLKETQIYLNIPRIAKKFKTPEKIVKKLSYSSTHELIHDCIESGNEELTHALSIIMTEEKDKEVTSLWCTEWSVQNKIKQITVVNLK